MNQHITEFLDYYIRLSNSPEYAVLIRGNWGAGKTYFINDYIENKESTSFLRVSLFGISSIDEIGESLFQQLHPILGSKALKYGSKILKGVIKATIKVDLDEEEKSSAIFSANPKDIKVPIWLKGIEKKVVVFDDLERCDLPIKSIMGYLNQLVENNGMKMILLANETELISKETSENSQYLLIKEKLIGRSFDIKSEPETALTQFIEDTGIGDPLRLNKDLLMQIFENGGYNNLRHLKQSILDFERFWGLLPLVRIDSKPKLIRHIIELFFSISIELKKGDIKEEDISELIEFNFLPGQADLTTKQKIKNKYLVFQKAKHPISAKLLTEYFKNGTIDKVEIKDEILHSFYYEDDNTPSWQKLQRFLDLENADFKALYDETLSDFMNCRMDSPDSILTTSSLFINFITMGMTDLKKDHILAMAKKNIDHLKETGELKDIDINLFLYIHKSTYQNQLKNDAEFSDLFSYITTRISEAISNSYHDQAEYLLNLLPDSIEEFSQKFLISGPNNKYSNIPLLNHFNVEDFTNKIMSIPNKNLRSFGWFLPERYKYCDANSNLLQEVQILQKIAASLENKISKDINYDIKALLIRNTIIPPIREVIMKLKAAANPKYDQLTGKPLSD